MAYDALAESIKLIGAGAVGSPVRLSRRRRFIPLAVDVDGDVAVAVFMRRSVGSHELEMHLLHRRGGDWQLLGGGGGSDDLDELACPWSVSERGYFGRVTGGASAALNADRRMPWGQRMVQSAWVQLASEVASVELHGRTIRVPWHHHVALVWRGNRVSDVLLNSADGVVLARLNIRW